MFSYPIYHKFFKSVLPDRKKDTSEMLNVYDERYGSLLLYDHFLEGPENGQHIFPGLLIYIMFL